MTCPKCGSNNVSVSMVQESGKTRTKGAGCLWSLGRTILIICTFGLWLLIGKRKATSNTKIKNHKEAICQNCGNSWVVR